ncbi:MAG: hypothetical protein KDA61_06600 [Planctomycetales bacterium]|nr:hypothetical protein [Planctomycetales bacterium]
MLQVVANYWWLALALAAGCYFALRWWIQGSFDAQVQGILNETQATFAKGSVDIHSLAVTGVTTVDGEDAVLYLVDATLTPALQQSTWSAADLYLYGVDKSGSPDRMRIGEVLQAHLWDGAKFGSIKKNFELESAQRLKLSIRFAGEPGLARFNYNFACFGDAFELPAAEPQLETSP